MEFGEEEEEEDEEETERETHVSVCMRPFFFF